MTSKLAYSISRLARTASKGLVTLVVTITAPLAVAQSTCPVIASTGTPDSTYNAAVAIQNGPGSGNEPAGYPGWTGSDGASSVLLPDGTSAFFFDDSFVGQSPMVTNDGTVTTNSNGLRTRATSVFYAHNLIAVYNPATNNFNTLVGAKNSNGFSTSYLVPPNTQNKYWPNSAIVLQTDNSGTQAVWASLGEFNGPNYLGTSIGKLAYPGLSFQNVAPFTNVLTVSGQTFRWGTSFVLTGSYPNYTLYVYSSSNAQPYIAKVAVNPTSSGIAYAANMANWLFYNSTYGWVTKADIDNDAAKAPTPIIGATGDPNNAGDTFVAASSVKILTTKTNGVIQTSYVVLGQHNDSGGSSSQLVLYTACSPQGPFSAKTVVYSPPEVGMTTVTGMTGSQQLSGVLHTYFPSMHPEFDFNGNLVVSYNVNSSDSSDLIYADAYRPRFIDVPIAGLQ